MHDPTLKNLHGTCDRSFAFKQWVKNKEKDVNVDIYLSMMLFLLS